MILPPGFRRWALCLAVCMHAAASAAPPSPLRAACGADQRERNAHDRDPTASDWAAVGRRDRERQDLVIAAVRAGRVRSFEDHRCAALILLHAGNEAPLRLAFALATQGQLLFPERAELRRLSALAWDRLMIARGQPQWFSTQFDTSGPGGEYRLYPLAAGVMDESERVALGGLGDAAARAELQRLNATARPLAPAAKPVVPAVRLQAAPALLRAALQEDEGLGNLLVQFTQAGVPLAPDGNAQSGRKFFLPRPAEAVIAFLDNPGTSFPRAPGSATPTTASGADYRLERAPDGGLRLLIGLEDAVQAAAVMTIRPTRRFEVDVDQVPGTGELAVLAFRRLPQP